MLTTLHTTFLLAGLAFVAIGIPLILKKIPPNQLYGFRTKKTLSNKQIWYAINKLAGIDLALGGAALMVTSLVTWRVGPTNVDHLAYVHVAVLAVALIGTTVHGMLALRRM